ncbi:hypothetical protein F5X98DRAFT_275231 [Xylaria grammica]|nr:hypothetical protein F5X98DRAFT_275231 [Xylaria grammica]
MRKFCQELFPRMPCRLPRKSCQHSRLLEVATKSPRYHDISGRHEICEPSSQDVVIQPERPRADIALLAVAKPALLGRCQEVSCRGHLAERYREAICDCSVLLDRNFRRTACEEVSTLWPSMLAPSWLATSKLSWYLFARFGVPSVCALVNKRHGPEIKRQRLQQPLGFMWDKSYLPSRCFDLCIGTTSLKIAPPDQVFVVPLVSDE